MANEEQINTNEAQVQQAVDAALKDQKKKKKKKRWIIIIVVLVVLFVIGVASSGGSDSDSESDSDGGTQTIQSDDSSDDEDDAEAESEEKIEAGYSTTTDDLKISYISCDTNFTDYYASVGSGNKVVRAEFEIENISSTDQSVSSMECYADGSKCDSFLFVDDYSSPSYESISSGRTLTAIVYYEVPKDAEEIEIEMELNVWTSEKIVFVVK